MKTLELFSSGRPMKMKTCPGLSNAARKEDARLSPSLVPVCMRVWGKQVFQCTQTIKTKWQKNKFSERERETGCPTDHSHVYCFKEVCQPGLKCMIGMW
ncbi:hypothetical protein ANANG_G00053260 [Anguilla anguilla]|uniref:Uncharacterized protein n=1 Tax=Anguilla anguilla TaxID=7936 RepID=A0A9D3MMJ0_ANGAN|nr:hypothetical protein ANANG_G00053260 [Anguilla anguilla]